MNNPIQLSLFNNNSDKLSIPKEPKNQTLIIDRINNTENKIELRPYQKDLKESALYYTNLDKNSMVYAPTGAGKTIIFCSIIADYINTGRRVLVIVNREFLINQIVNSLKLFNIKTKIGYIKAGYKEDRQARLQIGSVQTFMRRKIYLKADLIIIDECHTTCFHKAYSDINNHYNCPKIGFTASPWRLKNQYEFKLYFDKIISLPSSSIKTLMKNGYLCKARSFGFGGIIDFTDSEINRGQDFVIGKMQNKFIINKIPQLIVEHIMYHPEISGKKGIIFNSGVKQSILQTKLLNEKGISCVHIDGNTNQAERDNYFKMLENGNIQYISSVSTITEGLDVKSIEVIILARATLSLSLYIQMVGRGLRTYPGKTQCFVFDYGDNIKRFGVVTEEFAVNMEEPKRLEPSLKECPSCGHMNYAFSKICVNCGEEFPTKNKKNEEPFVPEFGEILDKRTLHLIKFIRSEKKRVYSDNLNPDIATEQFFNKYPNDFFFPNWLRASIFNEDSQKNREIYVNYLKTFNKSKKWLDYHFNLEFNIINPKILKGSKWYQILGVSENSDMSIIKNAYKKLALKYHPDVSDIDTAEAHERMQIINEAFEQAKVNLLY